eukprot:416859-Pleurochrysis_carterae.AAC.1
MSVNHAVQWEVEEAMGVSETVITIIKALREGTGGEHGGTVIQQAMQRLVPGIEFNTPAARGTPFLIYADDGNILTDS